MRLVLGLPYGNGRTSREAGLLMLAVKPLSGPAAMTTTLAMTLRKCSARWGSGGATFKHDGSQVVSACGGPSAVV
jgi:hypothetical protein